MKDTYIKASLELLQAGEPVEVVLKNMQQVMAKKGHSSLYASVLNGLVTQIEQQDQKSQPQVVLANAKDADAGKIKSLLKEIGSDSETYVTTVDDTVVGGLIVSHNYTMIDQSYKTKLKNLYQSIVSKTN